jgi:hypothetical protein
MQTLILASGAGLLVIGGYLWARKAWPDLAARLWALLKGVYARLRGLCGNSRTIAVAYAAELIGLLDEARVLDWSALIGSERAGRVLAIMGAVMIGLRLVTRAAVSFSPVGAGDRRPQA